MRPLVTVYSSHLWETLSSPSEEWLEQLPPWDTFLHKKCHEDLYLLVFWFL